MLPDSLHISTIYVSNSTPTKVNIFPLLIWNKDTRSRFLMSTECQIECKQLQLITHIPANNSLHPIDLSQRLHVHNFGSILIT